MMRPVSPILVAFALLASSARAQVHEQTHAVPLYEREAPFEASIAVPLFDPDLGTLIEVRLSVVPRLLAVMRAENTDPVLPEMVTLDFASAVTLGAGDHPLVAATSSGYVSQFLTPFDGALDYDGESGMEQVVVLDEPDAATIGVESESFAQFVGTAAESGVLHLPVRVTAVATCEPSGNPAVQFVARVQAGPSITVTYVYSGNGAAFCAGDGTVADCPCGNFGDEGHGCASPDSEAGAKLEASGEAQVSGDSLAFLVSHLPPTTVVVLLQGSDAISGGAPFGAGLQCLGGTVLRVAVRVAHGDVVLGGFGSGESVASWGGVPATGGMRYYQAAYRENPGACNGAAFNLTNGWRVQWRP